MLTKTDGQIILAGDFSSENFETILEICVEEYRDFVMHCHINSEMTATVYVYDALIEEAVLGPYDGLHVLALLVDDVSGGFELCPWQTPASNSIHLPISAALLTAAVRFDENKYKLRQAISKTIEKIGHFDNPFCLAGNLEDISLKQLLAYIADLGKSYIIELAISAEISGTIYFADGLICDARLGELSGIKAFALMLEHKQAKYTVTESQLEIAKTINLGINECIEEVQNIFAFK